LPDNFHDVGALADFFDVGVHDKSTFVDTLF
jgi:hypothetical protein